MTHKFVCIEYILSSKEDWDGLYLYFSIAHCVHICNIGGDAGSGSDHYQDGGKPRSYDTWPSRAGQCIIEAPLAGALECSVVLPPCSPDRG